MYSFAYISIGLDENATAKNRIEMVSLIFNTLFYDTNEDLGFQLIGPAVNVFIYFLLVRKTLLNSPKLF